MRVNGSKVRLCYDHSKEKRGRVGNRIINVLMLFFKENNIASLPMAGWRQNSPKF